MSSSPVSSTIIDHCIDRASGGGISSNSSSDTSCKPVAQDPLSPLSAMMASALNTFDDNLRVKSDLLVGNIIGVQCQVFHNLSAAEHEKHSIANNEGGVYTSNNTFSIDTFPTGRSPRDKYIVEQEPSRNHVWFGKINQSMSPEVFGELKQLCLDHLSQLDKVYVYDGKCGADPKTQRSVRVIAELAWQTHFCSNMFIDLGADQTFLSSPDIDFTIFNVSNVKNPNFGRQGLNSENFIAINIEEKLMLIGGTQYAGEMKKGMFSMMNYWLPLSKVLTLHCSSNVGNDGTTALFFGLSGTGKTTLSSDPQRLLIGDDEIGWSDEGVFNLEGGCYAKTVNLTEAFEPDIYAAIRKDALLENVFVDKETKIVDYFNIEKTENGRVSYKISHIANHEKSLRGKHPSFIILLCCDAFGILPPISLLNQGQCLYYFLSGYTSKIPGTEANVKQVEPTFSSCFGDPFLTLPPERYAEILQDKLSKNPIPVFLVSTGWQGGPFGVGKRISIAHIRACVHAIFDKQITPESLEVDPIFGFTFPTYINDRSTGKALVPAEILNPRNAWADKVQYDIEREKLAQMFVENFAAKFNNGREEQDQKDYEKHGPLANKL